jgi:signal transduction histidine kinase
MRHAHASAVEVRVAFAPDAVRLYIRDDGRGFDPASKESGEGLNAGLDGMRSRAEALGGQTTVSSVPGAGCEVTIEIPRYRAELKEIAQLA